VLLVCVSRFLFCFLPLRFNAFFLLPFDTFFCFLLLGAGVVYVETSCADIFCLQHHRAQEPQVARDRAVGVRACPRC
jgi:hypothetical protein